ncbi:hypothetical protein QYM36_008716 [Artemia franciscana]|uniref:Reverse transcriptase RNase H-like domain-containing protein n=1 Tax=Artemia franciscana TaxID=6661 RepID=A0AA88L0B0_ARTSF|nr:hypothetical protein QYM36_008716 [Artemia franciscana]
MEFRLEVKNKSCMREIKSCISENLAFFDHGWKTVGLKVDASKHRLGAKLSSNGKIVGFAYILIKTEQNYFQLEKELFAIVFECKHFHHYIYGHKTILTTDHHPVVKTIPLSLLHNCISVITANDHPNPAV